MEANQWFGLAKFWAREFKDKDRAMLCVRRAKEAMAAEAPRDSDYVFFRLFGCRS